MEGRITVSPACSKTSRLLVCFTLLLVGLENGARASCPPGTGTMRMVVAPRAVTDTNIIVTLRMESVTCPQNGYQAFLHFDPSKLTFVSGSYTAAPFTQPLIFPISATGGGDIDVANSVPGGGS